jgi:hypothetical protein
MPNMSYCRFRNTYNDLCDCVAPAWGSNDIYTQDTDEPDSDEERARLKLIELCKEVARNVGE